MPLIIMCGFWFLSCLISQMSLVFLSIIGSEKGLSNFPETLCSTSFDWLLDKRGSFKCSVGFQNFQIWFREYKASLPLPFEFRCNSFWPRCWALMLQFSIHTTFKVSRCLLTLRSLPFAFLWLICNVGLQTIIRQLVSCLKRLHFSISRLSMIFLDVLVLAAWAPMWRIK